MKKLLNKFFLILLLIMMVSTTCFASSGISVEKHKYDYQIDVMTVPGEIYTPSYNIGGNIYVNVYSKIYPSKYAIMDVETGKVVLDNIDSYTTYLVGNLIDFTQDGRYYIYDLKNQKYVCEALDLAELTFGDPVSEDGFFVTLASDKKLHFVSKDGVVGKAVDADYDKYVDGNRRLTTRSYIGDGLFMLVIGSFEHYELIGAINSTGQIYIYDADEIDYSAYSSTYIAGKNGKYGVINTYGNYVIPCEYDELKKNGKVYVGKKNNEYYRLDVNGNILSMLIPDYSKYDAVYNYFADGFAVVSKGTGNDFNKKYGVVNSLNEFIIPMNYGSIYAETFIDGICQLDLSESYTGAGKYGYIDENGNIVIPFEYDYILSFEEELACAKKDGKYGYIDKNGNIIIPFEYDNGMSFSEGLAPVSKNGKYGFIGKDGVVIIPFEYDYASIFNDGVAQVRQGAENFQINKQNEIVNLIVKEKYSLTGRYDYGNNYAYTGGIRINEIGETVDITNLNLIPTTVGENNEYIIAYSNDYTQAYKLVIVDNRKEQFSDITFSDAAYNYDGTEKSIKISGNLPDGATVSYTNEKGTNAGTYNATAVIEAEGYETLTLNATLTINKANISVKADDKNIMVKEQLPLLTYTVTSGKLYGADTITGSLSTDADINVAGNYDITIGTLTAGKNYNLIFTKGTLSIVEKIPQDVNVETVGEKTYGDASFALNITDNNPELGIFTFSSSNNDVIDVSDDGTVNIKSAGTAEITVSRNGNEEYATFEKTIEIVINKKNITVASIDVDAKTIVFEGLISEDTSVTIDFDKIEVTINESESDTTVNASVSNFILTGEKSENYIITTENVNTTVSRENVIKVTFSAENGSVTGTGEYYKGSNINVTAIPDSGYAFDGWYNSDEHLSSNITYSFIAEENIELTAKFRKIPSRGSSSTANKTTYSITFETNGGSLVPQQNVMYNATIIEPTEPVKEGYKFMGWFTDEKLAKPYVFGKKITAGTKLYAKWEEISKHQIVLKIGDKNANVFGENKVNDVAPKIVNGRTMLPIRFIAEALGAEVIWKEAEPNKVVIKQDDIEIVINIGSDTALVNNKKIGLDSTAFIENDRTYLPLRFVSENLGAIVDWDNETETVTITK